MKSFGAAVIVLVLALTATATPARAADRITITNYGINITTLPWAVALERGLFQREGVDIDGFVGSSGGGSAIRNMMASKIPFAEVSVPAAVAALQNGIELKIVYGALYHLGELSWMVRKDSTIKSIADLRGRKVAYTSPQSVTEMVVRMVLDAHHITSDVTLIPPVASRRARGAGSRRGRCGAGGDTGLSFAAGQIPGGLPHVGRIAGRADPSRRGHGRLRESTSGYRA